MSILSARTWMTLTLSVYLILPSLVNAADDDYICEARQNSDNELPILSEACPVGTGMWGVPPKEDQGLFWVQCGLLAKPLTLEEAKLIKKTVSGDVWAKKENNDYRCLIGPYESYAVANSELGNVKKVKGYKDAFIRNASSLSESSQSTLSSAAKVAPKEQTQVAETKKSAPQEKKTPEIVATETVSAPMDSDEEAKPKLARSIETVVARRDVKIGEKYYVIPFLMEGYDQFYMEYGIAWNRLNYDRAEQVCDSQHMKVPDQNEWQLLLDSQVMSEKQWPIHLPYWGKGKKGLFTSGKVTQLSGTSLLNVVCVK